MAFISEQDYPKGYGNKTYPVLANKISNLIKRVEPILTPEKLTSRYLKGIDLSQYNDDDLKDKINLAMSETEIYPNQKFLNSLLIFFLCWFCLHRQHP